MHNLFKLFVIFLFVVILLGQAPSSFAYEVQQGATLVQFTNSSAQRFDVTTQEGREKALMWDLLCPTCWLIQWGWNNFAPGNVAARETEAQQRTAVEIIRAGKKNNVDELEITMSEKAGLGFDVKVEGVPIEFLVGNSGTMTLRVKYKS